MMSEWTVDTLKEYLDKLRETDQASIKTALDSANKRADQSNEIRGAMVDQQKTLATVVAHNALADRVGKLENLQAADSGKSAGIGLVWGGAIAIIVAGTTVAAFIFR
jgi:cephalosporin-C deacetylase-like acetyl esterase